MVLYIAQFVVFVVTRCDCVKTTHDGNNNASELNTPLVVLHEFVKVVLRHFISDVLNVYQPCFDRFWFEEEIDEIKAE
jgi:hypothetical protein